MGEDRVDLLPLCLHRRLCHPHPVDDAAVQAVRRAIEDAGSHPGYHRSVMKRHRAEWPALWRALDQLLEQPAPRGYLLVDGRGRDVVDLPVPPTLL